MVRAQPGDPWEELVWSAVQGVAWAIWSMLLFSIPGLVLKRRFVPGLRWLSLVPWGLYLQLFLRTDFDDPGMVTKLYIRACWDPPLIWTGQLARHFGHRLLRPFHSDVDDAITVGSFPMVGDVSWMSEHGVVAVVNMCAEWAGPRAEYRRAGIEQLHLPTVDTTSPTAEALIQGVRFINRTLSEARARFDPDSDQAPPRVFIHCKGGIGRAATMALSWYVVAHGLDLEQAMRLLKAKRPIVSDSVLRYSALRFLEGKYARGRASEAEPPAAEPGVESMPQDANSVALGAAEPQSEGSEAGRRLGGDEL